MADTTVTVADPRFRVQAGGTRYVVSVRQTYTRAVRVRIADRVTTVKQGPTFRVGVDRRASRVITAGVQGARGAPGAGTVFGFQGENRAAVPIAAGSAVASHATGVGFVAAVASAGSGLHCVGVATQAIASGFAGTVQTGGVLTLPDWTAAVGSVLLAPRATYFLSAAVPGRLTAVPPAGVGELAQPVGYAIAPDSLMIELDYPIRL